MAISVHELTEYISWASDDYLHLALSDGTDGKITKANIISGLATPGALDVYYVKRSNNLSDIANPELARANLNLGSVALLNEITKSDIVDFNEADYATAAQGALANSALQPGDNISELVNDAGYILTSQKGVANGVASLDSNGKIPEIQIPAIAISNTFVVDSELEMLALDAQVGDIAIRNDESKSYILQGTDASDLSDWQDLKTPAGGVASVNGQTGTVILDADDIDDSVTTNKFVTSAQITKLAGIEAGAQVNTVDSVNGQTGTVVLVKADVGLSNVDNTSDLAKPISTATQTALNAKQDTITGAATTITGSNLTANRAVISNGSGKVAVSTVTSTELGYVAGVTSAIQTQLNDKATSAQGALADTAVQPGANITVLTNDAGYITSAGAPVQSVNGLTGTVVLTKASVGLGNVDDTSDLAKPISTATQTALDGKQATVTGAATTITGSNLTASRALVSDASGKVAVSPVMSSEVAHLSGVTAGIQGQINAKANSSVNLVAGTGLTGGGDLTADRSFAVTYGTTAGTAAQGNDTRLSDAREWTASTITQAEAETGTATTRRAWTAQRVRQAIVAWWSTVGTTIGNNLLNLANVSVTSFIRVNSNNTVTARTASEFRSDLGLGTAATETLTTSTSDTTVGRVLKVGDYGLGRGLNAMPDQQYNDLTVPGTYFLNSTTAGNNPPITTAPFLVTVSTGSEGGVNTRITQKAVTYGVTPSRYFRRGFNGTVWTAWDEIYHSGSSIPVGKITGLGTAAAATLTTSTSDTTAGRVLKVGDFNIGTAAALETNVDLNTKVTPGRYLISVTGQTNGPSSDPTITGALEVSLLTTGGATLILQKFYSTSLPQIGRVFVRLNDGSSWQSWREQYSSNANSVVPVVNGGTGGITASDARTNLGLGTAATATLTTTTQSTTTGQVVKVGDYGMGVAPQFLSNQQYNDLTTPGNYACSGTTTGNNAPIEAVAFLVTVSAGQGSVLNDRISQQAVTYGAIPGRYFRRGFNGTTWGPWDEFYHSGTTIPNTQITGLGTAATATLTTSTSDTTVGRVLKVGDYNIGTTVTVAQIGYLSGVTSSIQTQLNGKASLSAANTWTANQTFSDVIRLRSGTPFSPALGVTFTDDPDTGIHNFGSDRLGLVTGGETRFAVYNTSVESYVPVRLPNGGIESPSIGPASNSGTGLSFTPQNILLSVGGELVLQVGPNGTFPGTDSRFAGNGAVPAGGTTGQVLAKTSGADYAVGWVTPSGGTNIVAGNGITVTGDTVSVNSTVVRTTGTQSIGGTKTFTSEVTAPSFNTTSSLKYKKDVMPFENALEKLMAIDVITYKRKIPEGEPQDDKTYLGVSAESLAKVVPELVNFKDGEADSVNYAQGFALCVQAIQELVQELKKQ